MYLQKMTSTDTLLNNLWLTCTIYRIRFYGSLHKLSYTEYKSKVS